METNEGDIIIEKRNYSTKQYAEKYHDAEQDFVEWFTEQQINHLSLMCDKWQEMEDKAFAKWFETFEMNETANGNW